MKLLFSILLTASIFAQDKGNQNSYAIDSYAIETTSQYYQDVSLDSVVYGIQVEVYDRRLNTSLNIPIAEIKTLRQNGRRQKWKPNMLVKAIGTAAGGAVGCVSGIFVGFAVSYGYYDNRPAAIVIASTGGGAMLGYKLVSGKRRYEVIDFYNLTLDEKRNHLNSIANQ